ncbi:hypothetical protein GF358_04705 [Candidatus Woesearchaeota archaeon]|nr:hypothetical protein [Candidatus Woesearchaeota archaeon]
MKLSLIFGIIALMIFTVSCVPSAPINDFESCIAAGNPAMESYPRQCRANGQTFVEEIDEPVKDNKPLLGGCGTVTPGMNDDCCENVMKDAIHIQCVGGWKWSFEKNQCEYVCATEETSSDFKELKSSDNNRILCEADEDCELEFVKGTNSDLELPVCDAQLACRNGICVYRC